MLRRRPALRRLLAATIAVLCLAAPAAAASEMSSYTPFSGGLANADGVFMNTSGKIAFNHSYIAEAGFSEGLTPVMDPATMRYGYMNTSGSLVIPCTYVSAGGFSEGLAPVHDSYTSAGFIDKTGAVVIPLQYGAVTAFSGGRAGVYINGLWGYIDKSGNTVAAPQFKYASAFSENFAAVANGDGKWGFVGLSGALSIPCRFDYATDFSDGYAAVIKDGKWGYIDTSGDFAIPAIYDMAHPFSEGLASVTVARKEGFIDKMGNMAIAAQTAWTYSAPFCEGLALVADARTYSLGYIDKTGAVAVALRYSDATSFSEGYALVVSGGVCTALKNPLASKPGATPSSWAKAEVDAAINLGLVPAALQSGYQSNITRAEFCGLAVRLIEAKSGKALPATTTFSDTADPAVLKLATAGIVDGVGGGRFNPGGTLTREQAAKMLAETAKYLGLGEKSGAAAFIDKGEAGLWASGYIDYVSAHGIMTGVGEGRFDPKGAYSVEQSIMTIYRLYGKV